MKFTLPQITLATLGLAGLASCTPTPAVASAQLQETALQFFTVDENSPFFNWEGGDCFQGARILHPYGAQVFAGCARLYSDPICSGDYVEIHAGEWRELRLPVLSMAAC
ncbi:hypothetical protein DFH07DRAFT_966615 [Mycena maculata]|uniref:Uncharacterized protein n=1 Tax=Mycena maculata TaxID=230809 RepID=A0AAD7I856_9AGAR|nr:hypothetical protein DFH07DRAFT_966615 [Mycena maculata]